MTRMAASPFRKDPSCFDVSRKAPMPVHCRYTSRPPGLATKQTNALIKYGLDFPPLGTGFNNTGEELGSYLKKTKLSGTLICLVCRCFIYNSWNQKTAYLSSSPAASCEEKPHRSCHRVRCVAVGKTGALSHSSALY